MIATIQRKGRRAHGAKCTYCNKRHGDGAPWWNESKRGWSLTYRTPDGKSRNRLLAKGRDGHDEAIRLWKDMLGADGELPLTESGEDTTVEALVAQRLAYLKENAGVSTFKNSEGILNDFCY